MAHTLNEQVRVIPAGTGDTNIELILDTIVEFTGWYRDGYTVYCDDAHTMGLRFNWSSGGSSCRAEGFFGGNIVLNYKGSYAVSSGVTIRAHKSSDESVTYLDAGDPLIRLIHTKNVNGDDLLFMPSDSAGYIAGGSPTKTATVEFSMPVYTTEKTYCITKMPDVINGAEIPNLYMVVGTATPAQHNQLVSFNEAVFRVAFMGSTYDTYRSAFAFPVSD